MKETKVPRIQNFIRKIVTFCAAKLLTSDNMIWR